MSKKPKSEEVEKKDTWSEDQKDHEYYYDDAHGYEKYEPEEEEDAGSESSATHYARLYLSAALDLAFAASTSQ
jgi:hypothetical protein